MIISKKIDYCSCCGNYTEFHYGTDDYDLSKLDLDNYLKYKDIYVYTCAKCGMISTDLSKEDKSLFDSIKNTDRYNDVMTYEYLQGYDLELFENHTRSVPANLYESFAMMYENSSNKEIYLRALHKSIELKEIILEKYADEIEEDDEYDEETYSKLEDLMIENIENARKRYVNEFLKYEDKNAFLFLMFVENLINLGEVESARDNLEWLISNSNISDDLIDYIKDLTNEE